MSPKSPKSAPPDWRADDIPLRTLVIDSATGACSVALFDCEGSGAPELIAGEFRMLGRGHAEALVPMIAALPDRGWAGRIAVALGPGSFTGVRVGLAAARALALVWGSELIGYPTLALVAAAARQQAGAVRIGAVMTGGHGEWFVQVFAADGTPEGALASLAPAAAGAVLDADTLAGNQAAAALALRGYGRAIEAEPDARNFALLAPHALSHDIGPLYGRAPDAKPSAASPR